MKYRNSKNENRKSGSPSGSPEASGRWAELGLFLLIPLTVAAQSVPKAEDVVSLRAEPAQLTIAAGRTASLTLSVQIIPSFHINSNKPLEGYLIPSEVFLPAAGEFELIEVKYPEAKLKTFSFAPGEKLAVYEGMIELPVRLRARAGIKPGARKLALALRYQACNDQLCLRPVERRLNLSVKVVPKGSPRATR